MAQSSNLIEFQSFSIENIDQKFDNDDKLKLIINKIISCLDLDDNERKK